MAERRLRSPLWGRLWVVALTYLQPRWIWLCYLLWALFYAGQWVELIRQRDQTALTTAGPSMPRPGDVWPKPQDASVSAESLSRVRTLELFTDTQVLRTPQAASLLPQIESAIFFQPVTAPDLALLAQLPRLRALTLFQTDGLTAADLSQLSASVTLRQLTVVENTGYVNATEPIVWPKNLRIVQLRGPRSLPVQRLEELQQLPDLQTLETRLLPTSQEGHLAEPYLSALKNLPALRRLYLDDLPSIYPQLLAGVQAELPAVAVRPSYYERERSQRNATAIIGLCAACGLVLVHLSGQFLSSHAPTVPGFAGPHGLVACVWLGLAVFAEGIYSLATGVSWVAYLGNVGAVGLYVCCLVALLKAADPAMPGFTQPVTVLPLLVLLVPVLALLSSWFGGDYDWYLTGHFSGLSALLVCSGLVAIWRLARGIQGWQRALVLRGADKAPLWTMSTDPMELSRQAWQRRPTSVMNERWQSLILGADLRLDAAIRDGGWERLTAAADQLSPVRFTILGAIFLPLMAGGMFLSQRWFGSSQGAELEPLTAEGMLRGLGMFCFYLAMLYSYIAGLSLFQRAAHFELELLRPLSRREWQTRWFYRLAQQVLVPISLCVVGGLLLGTATRTLQNEPAVFLALCGFGTALSLNVFAAVLLLVTYRAGLWVFVSLIPVFGMVMLAVSLGRQNLLPVDGWGFLPTMASISALLTGLAVALLVCGWRRWSHWELALLHRR